MNAKAPAHAGLAAFEDRAEFAARHVGTTPDDQAAMLAALGYPSRAALIDAIVPAGIRERAPLPLPGPVPESEALARLKSIAAENRVLTSHIGQGYYGTHTPGVILRNILENPAWYTAYTPYQPEISQGRLEALINFQTMVCDLTGMAITNASMLDEATAAAEAMALALRVGRSESRRFFVADDVFPQTLDVVRTRAAPLGVTVVVGPAQDAAGAGAFAALLQYPGGFGDVRDDRVLAEALHAQGALVIVAADILALAVLAPPGEWGADAVVGSTQRFGVPMGYGGPHAGYLATRDEFKRSLPGRLVGVTVDVQGNPAYRLALQTREQHIRREKATSNICTAQVLLAVIASMYAVYHGAEGLVRIARRTHRLAAILKAGLGKLGWTVPTAAFFDTIAVATGERTQRVLDDGVAHGVNFRRIDAATIGIALDETTTRDDVERILAVFHGGAAPVTVEALDAEVSDALPLALVRTSPFLTHPVFRRHHSETEMLRYLRRLADRDLALDRAMIPLGSCTMKLNATSAMTPVDVARVRRPASIRSRGAGRGIPPGDRRRRAHAVRVHRIRCGVAAAERGLAGRVRGPARHPRMAREPRRSPSRRVPHSRVRARYQSRRRSMAGMQASSSRATMPVTSTSRTSKRRPPRMRARWPRSWSPTRRRTACSRPASARLCEIVHAHGGQVYVDGANLNALVGLAAPGHFGADVSHLNLHKTFCIPHGGGGPGVGPVAVKAHLAPFLPGHFALTPSSSPASGRGEMSSGGVAGAGPALTPSPSPASGRGEMSSGGVAAAGSTGAVSAAPYGSASILPISWMYVTMMGAEGLRAATEGAVLAANYVARMLAPHYPILFTGPRGLVAHECILDLRPLKATSAVEAEDVAKRLIDYGFHAPTMSFPVAGTLMVEPTESESKAELDRFIDAMIAIRGEIRAIEEGRMDRADNPLKRAPHTAATVSADEWPHRYSRLTAAWPSVAQKAAKYWPPVARVDNVYGDRNLFCSCIPIAELEPAA